MNEDEWLKDFRSDEDAMNGCFGQMGIIVLFWLLILLLILLAGCKGVKYVTVPEVHTDTLYISKLQRDSIYLQDSTNVSEKQQGDTLIIRITKWHTEYRDRTVHDTIYQHKVDSIAYPVEVIKEVKKDLSWWQKTRIHLGEVLLGIIGIALVYLILKVKRIFLP